MGALDGALSLLGGGGKSAPMVPADDPQWQVPPDVQAQRDRQRLEILRGEYATEKNPANRASLQREIVRTSASVPASPAVENTQGGALDGALSILSGQYQSQTPPTPKPVERGITDKIIGAGEAALHLASGIPASVPAAVAGLTSIFTNGKYGTQAGVREAGNRFSDVMEAYTYSPRTQAGREYSEKVGQALNDSGVIALAPVAGDVHVLAQGTKPLSSLIKGEAQEQVARLKQSTKPQLTKEEPTLVPTQVQPIPQKPRVKLNVDGTIEPVAQPEAAQSPTMQQTGQSPKAQPPKPTSPEIVSAIDKATKKGDLNPEAAARHAEADSLPVPARLTLGQATQDVTQLSHEQNMRGKHQELANLFNGQNQNLIDNLNAIREKAAPDVTATNPVEAGQHLVDAYKSMDAKRSADITQKYQALKDANGGDFPLDAKTFVDNADSALHKELLYDHVPPSIRSTLDRLKNGGSMTFENFESLRTNLARIQRSQSVDGNVQAAAGVIRNALEDLPMPAGAEHLKPLADAARAAAKDRFDLIKRDPAYKAVVNDEAAIGEPSPLADKFVEGYIVNGKRANVQQMIQNLAEDSTARQTIAAGTLDHLKSVSGVDLRTNTGNVSQAAYNKVLSSKIGPKIDLLFDPESAQHVTTLGNVARYQQFQPRGSFVNNSNTLVATVAKGAKSAAEGAANVAAKGVPVGTWARQAAEKMGEASAVKKATKPGAGVRIKDLPK